MLDGRRFVLVVEDTETCADTLEIALASLPGVEIRSVGSAEEALEMVARYPMAAVVTDVHLPSQDGFQLLRLLRAQAGSRHIPVLMISGDSHPGTPARALREGADAFFAKPYSPAAVRRKLEELLYAS